MPTQPTKNPYHLTDELWPDLEKELRAILSNSALRICSFDEINQQEVLTVLRPAFSQMLTAAKRRYLRIIKRTYRSFGIILTGKEALTLLGALLHRADPITGYRFDSEFTRKRTRLIEEILATPGEQSIRRKFAKALPIIFLMLWQYMDIAIDDSRQDAMRRNGVKRVRWITEEDERVCKICKDRQDKIYVIDLIPPKPHYRCRCHTEPVI